MLCNAYNGMNFDKDLLNSRHLNIKTYLVPSWFVVFANWLFIVCSQSDMCQCLQRIKWFRLLGLCAPLSWCLYMWVHENQNTTSSWESTQTNQQLSLAQIKFAWKQKPDRSSSKWDRSGSDANTLVEVSLFGMSEARGWEVPFHVQRWLFPFDAWRLETSSWFILLVRLNRSVAILDLRLWCSGAPLLPIDRQCCIRLDTAAHDTAGWIIYCNGMLGTFRVMEGRGGGGLSASVRTTDLSPALRRDTERLVQMGLQRQSKRNTQSGDTFWTC